MALDLRLVPLAVQAVRRRALRAADHDAEPDAGIVSNVRRSVVADLGRNVPLAVPTEHRHLAEHASVIAGKTASRVL